MRKKKFIDWLSRIGNDETKIIFWWPGADGEFQITGADWNDREKKKVLIVSEGAGYEEENYTPWNTQE